MLSIQGGAHTGRIPTRQLSSKILAVESNVKAKLVEHGYGDLEVYSSDISSRIIVYTGKGANANERRLSVLEQLRLIEGAIDNNDDESVKINGKKVYASNKIRLSVLEQLRSIEGAIDNNDDESVTINGIRVYAAIEGRTKS